MADEEKRMEMRRMEEEGNQDEELGESTYGLDELVEMELDLPPRLQIGNNQPLLPARTNNQAIDVSLEALALQSPHGETQEDSGWSGHDDNIEFESYKKYNDTESRTLQDANDKKDLPHLSASDKRRKDRRESLERVILGGDRHPYSTDDAEDNEHSSCTLQDIAYRPRRRSSSSSSKARPLPEKKPKHGGIYALLLQNANAEAQPVMVSNFTGGPEIVDEEHPSPYESRLTSKKPRHGGIYRTLQSRSSS